MVKHQRRSHPKLIHSDLDDEEISESESDESLFETQHSTRVMRPERIPQNLVMFDKRQVQSFAGYERHQDDFRFQNKLSYIQEQNNPRVATFNADVPPATQSLHRHLPQNLQSSPSSYSTASTASPLPQKDVYSLFPTKMASHGLQSQHLSLIEQQFMVCQQQLPHDPVPLPYWSLDEFATIHLVNY